MSKIGVNGLGRRRKPSRRPDRSLAALRALGAIAVAVGLSGFHPLVVPAASHEGRCGSPCPETLQPGSSREPPASPRAAHQGGSKAGSPDEVDAEPPGATPAPGVGEPPAASSTGTTPPLVIERRPEGGLAYRITMSADATSGRPDRLIVWLHPTGRLANQLVEALAPILHRHGFALMVMIDKDPRGWTHDHARMLLGVSLPDAGTIAGIDLRRPLLLGFSAGGQVALDLWMTKPGLYGGLILDAAYPADSVDGRNRLFAPPSDPAVREVPLLALVGGDDPLLWVWEKLRQPWIDAGVPLTIVVAAGKGHEWLFGEDQVKELETWLDRLPALPGADGAREAKPQPGPDPGR